MLCALRWGAGSVLLAAFVWLAVMNAIVFVKRHVLKRKAPSWIPLLGGIFGVGACYVLPIGDFRWWWFMPLVVDWGSLPGIVDSLAFHLRRCASGVPAVPAPRTEDGTEAGKKAADEAGEDGQKRGGQGVK